ncbi:hypothetical protein CLV78_104256 [Aliiruegeria haliotis]|uniref:Glutamine amidotransferase n=1 Tax=Aliiruegeria haliotis TaxID=1280846 RepID=A0A2T0RRE8_9RHOB|nr:hypothetical protein [Aliiruegeria haliotis]PRY23764.1 hypothetical protein CLV78_104256 [Aliiruegeria haliotis]
MTRATDILFDPLLSWAVIWIGTALAVALVALAAWRGLRGWWLRGLAAAALLVAIANPSYQIEERTALSDIVLLVVDRSASQQISDRAAQTDAAVQRIVDEVERLPNTEVRIATVYDGNDNAGTLAATALAELVAEEPRARIAGAILVSDGQLHDIERMPALPAPLHLLQTGHDTDWDRRLLIRNAPTFAIMGEEVTLTLRIEESGAVPATMEGTVSLSIGIDGDAPVIVDVPVGEDLQLPLTLPHGGMNVVRFEVAAAEGELTDRNNAAVVQINGVRDRLRVLLVSGEPHAGERTWRNLLKSDSSVDLVHFTILRPPEKQDGVPVTELSLIAFPTRELFLDKIDEFDLIIFDRYKRRGILPMIYLENVRNYVESGGAVLVAAGPDFAGADSLYRSPLADVLPAAPTARVLEQGYRPQITETGRKHPVTEGLDQLAPPPADGSEGPGWGRWFRIVDLLPEAGHVVMDGPDNRPLLVLDRAGEGRVALLASDHAWLWSRGFEGGGPQMELLRRLAHWMMKEPELEEEALTAVAEGLDVVVTRRSLGEAPGDVEVTAPDGSVLLVPLTEVAPGRFTGRFTGEAPGLYRLTESDLERVIALGPAAPKEFEQTIASGTLLAPSVAERRGGVLRIEEGVSAVRQVREGRAAAGRNWIGITPREAYRTADLTVIPLVAPLLFLLLAMALSIGAWLREGRR